MSRIIFILLVFSVFIYAQDLQSTQELMNLSLEELLNIEIVSASKKAESSFEAPLSSNVITAEDIKKAGCTSVMEALRLFPEVIVREQTPGNYDIHIRGLDNIDPNGVILTTANTVTLVMINNRIVYNDFQGGTYWELLQVNINDIEKIEVVRGPVAAMYGPNAVTGVINIITKGALLKDKNFSISTYSMGGNNTTGLVSGSINYNINNNFAIKFTGNYDRRNRGNVDYFILSGKKAINFNPNGTPKSPYAPVSWVNTLDTTLLNTNNGILKNPDKPRGLPSNINERYPDLKKATDRYNYTGLLEYSNKENEINVMLFGGYSNSTVQRALIHNNFTPLSFDEGHNSFVQVMGNYQKFQLNLDFSTGKQKTLGSGKTLEFSYKVYNFNVEYDIDIIENLNLRLGAASRSSIYNGQIIGSIRLNPAYTFSDYLGDRKNTSLSGFGRLEYKIENFRLIAALRGDKYETPNKIFISPQVIAFYKINDNNNIRISYSQAARSPFMTNIFTDLIVTSSAGPTTKFIFDYKGNPKQEFLTSDQFELGGRSKVTDNLSFEYSTFYSQTKNFDVLTTVNRVISTVSGVTTYNYQISYINIDAKAKQIGASLASTIIATNNLLIKPYITYQQTKVDDYYDSLDINGKAVDKKTDSDNSKYINFTHKATPSLYGGIIINYSPFKELNINLNNYFMTEQTMSVIGIKQKSKDMFLINLTISYEFYKNMKIFATARNLGTSERQFAFTDKTSSFYGLGLDINY